jgi:chromosome segregation ATPase
MILPVGEFSPIIKLVDHIEAQGKQLRELNAAITKKNATIEKYEHKNKDLRERNALLVKKVDELNEGIRNSEDLTWKQKYDALLQSSEQAIGALQKKCQEYKNADSDATASTIVALIEENQKLFHENNKLKEDLEKEKQVSKDLNVIINSKNKLLDIYMTKCNKLEERRDELKKELDFWKASDTFSTASYLTKRCNKAEETLSKIRDLIDGKE